MLLMVSQDLTVFRNKSSDQLLQYEAHKRTQFDTRNCGSTCCSGLLKHVIKLAVSHKLSDLMPKTYFN